MRNNMNQVKKIKYELLAQEYAKTISSKENRISDLTHKLSKKNSIEDQYIILAIVIFELQIFNLYFELNTKHNELFGKNSSPLLDKARKLFVHIMNLLDERFGTNINSSLSSNSEMLKKLKKLTPKRLFNLIHKLESACIVLKNTYGVSSKYFGNIISLYGQIAGFITNSVNFKEYLIQAQDLSNEHYIEIISLLDYSEQILEEASNLYIEGFQLTESRKMLQNGLKTLSVLEHLTRLQKKPNLNNIIRKKQTWQRLLDT